MANPNPSPETRFSADNPGRAKGPGARNRLSAAFLTALADDFDLHGVAVIQSVREKDPSTYARIVASLQPKEMEITTPESALSDEQVEEFYAILSALVAEKSDKAKAAH